MRRFFFAVLLIVAAAPFAKAQEVTNAQIRDVITRVARHQLMPIADGDYASVSSLDQAKSARPPSGIAWFYPQGVMLDGMSRAADITHDRDVEAFVIRHNQVAARYYHWLAQVRQQFGDEAEGFFATTFLKQLMALGSLDSCGAMGAALLDSMIRHSDQVTAEEREVLARIADWILNRQGRMPDGMLWRPERGGTVWPDDVYMGGAFLVRYGLYTHDNRYIDDAARNIIQQAALEQDRDGLWFHGYFMDSKSHAPFKWARGNG